MRVFQGLLREDDLQHFDEDFRQKFKARPADVSEDGWEEDWISYFSLPLEGSLVLHRKCCG